VAKSPPDGYTWLMSTASSLITGTFSPGVPFDQARDLAPVILMASIPFVLVVNPALPAQSVPELIALAKSQPGKLSYASSGNGGSGHLVGEMFKHAAGIDMLHVPYKGVMPSVTDLIGGQVQLSFIPAQAALPQAKIGKLRALAVTSLKRSLAAPELPTIAELGYPGFEMIGWNGLHVPAKTPHAIIVRINTEVAKALAQPEIRERMLAAGLEPAPRSIEDFDAFVKRDVARYTKVIHDSKIVFE
jgi:tripartite-type tricarboxylate transporter receptor subunit TctC